MRRLLVVILMVLLSACVATTVPVDLTEGRVLKLGAKQGQRVPVTIVQNPKAGAIGAEEYQVQPLELGTTSRAEVVARLGPPDVSLDEERTIAYVWHHIDKVIKSTFLPRGGQPVPVDLGRSERQHLVLLQFDDTGRLHRIEHINREPLAPGIYAGDARDARQSQQRDAIRRWARGETKVE